MLASMLEIPNDVWVKKKNLLKKDLLIKKINRKFNQKGSLIYSFSHFDLDTQIFYLKDIWLTNLFIQIPSSKYDFSIFSKAIA